MADRLLTVEELAEYLRVPVKTVYAWRYRGEGPRVGGSWSVRPIQAQRRRCVDRSALRRRGEGLVTAALERVAEYRSVTRRILRELGDADRTAALIRLKDHAKTEELAAWCMQAIVEEIGWQHERAAVYEQRSYGDRLERAHRRLRGQGYAACPTCESALSTEADWQHWRQLREAAIREAEAKEHAV